MNKLALIQIGRFLCIGILNTVIDFTVFNVLIAVFGLETGLYPLFKALGFCLAVVNSYLWNKHWVFGATSTKDHMKESGSFILVSVVGLLVNNVVSYAGYLVLSHVFVGVSSVLVANISALLGTFAVLTLNFLGYKFLVFKRSDV